MSLNCDNVDTTNARIFDMKVMCDVAVFMFGPLNICALIRFQKDTDPNSAIIVSIAIPLRGESDKMLEKLRA